MTTRTGVHGPFSRSVVLLLVLLTIGLLQSAPSAPAGPAPAAASATSGVMGSGPLLRFACLGCASAIVGLGGGSIIGYAVMTLAMPEVVALCGWSCYEAFR